VKQTLTILLVDDEKPFVEAMGKRLARRGFAVHGANSGQEALDLLAAHPEVNAVVLDLKMPGMDGLATLRAMKAARPGLAVLLLTGHGTVEAAREGLALGAFDFLLKPSDLDELTSKLQAAALGPGEWRE
jgi:DNA-binding NtrC family response regulator